MGETEVFNFWPIFITFCLHSLAYLRNWHCKNQFLFFINFIAKFPEHLTSVKMNIIDLWDHNKCKKSKGVNTYRGTKF